MKKQITLDVIINLNLNEFLLSGSRLVRPTTHLWDDESPNDLDLYEYGRLVAECAAPETALLFLNYEIHLKQ
jgi:hypothetical protein